MKSFATTLMSESDCVAVFVALLDASAGVTTELACVVATTKTTTPFSISLD